MINLFAQTYLAGVGWTDDLLTATTCWPFRKSHRWDGPASAEFPPQLLSLAIGSSGSAMIWRHHEASEMLFELTADRVKINE